MQKRKVSWSAKKCEDGAETSEVAFQGEREISIVERIHTNEKGLSVTRSRNGATYLSDQTIALATIAAISFPANVTGGEDLVAGLNNSIMCCTSGEIFMRLDFSLFAPKDDVFWDVMDDWQSMLGFSNSAGFDSRESVAWPEYAHDKLYGSFEGNSDFDLISKGHTVIHVGWRCEGPCSLGTSNVSISDSGLSRLGREGDVNPPGWLPF